MLSSVIEVSGKSNASTIVSVPHGGTLIPPRIQQQLAVPLAEAQDRVDTYTRELADAAAPCATIVKANISRTAIDLNRSPTICELDLRADPEQERDRLVRLYARDGRPLWKSRVGEPWMTREELEIRLREYHEPYHAALAKLLAGADPPLFLVDLHSMSDPAFDIVIGDFRGRSVGVHLCERLLKPFLTSRGYRVGYAGPREIDHQGRRLAAAAIRYSGGFITARYGRPTAGQYAFQIEVCRETCHTDPARMARAFREFFAFLDEERASLPG